MALSLSLAMAMAGTGTGTVTSNWTPSPPLLPQKTNFHGVSVQAANNLLFNNPLLLPVPLSVSVKPGFQIRARAAGASKTIEVDVDKPLGLTLGQLPAGGVVITGVDGGGNAAKAGLKSGDQPYRELMAAVRPEHLTSALIVASSTHCKSHSMNSPMITHAHNV